MRAGSREDGRSESCLIIGAGPAGLTAAYEAMQLGLPAKVLEKDDVVGGISRTVVYNDFRFDIGGHRFFTKIEEVERLWHTILGDDLLVRPRLSRIHYRDRFFAYPVKLVDALVGLGPVEAVRIVTSYLSARLFPSPEERTFEQWVSNRFGRRLFEIFFKTYTEKVWGMSCSEIGADWAAQRIQNLDLVTAVKNALLGDRSNGGEIVTSLIDRFLYPRHGPGMLWERCRDMLAEAGYPTITGAEVVRIRHADGRVTSVDVRDRSGREWEEAADHFISSMPIRELLNAFDPLPPASVVEAANRLRYRDFLTVALIVDRDEIFPDNWIYIHSPKVQVGRIQNPKSWSEEMVPDTGQSSLALEYFVQEGDALWTADDSDLIELGKRECEELGLIDAADVIDGTVVRMPKAYPVYDAVYKEALQEIRSYLDGIENLQLIGRNGQHRYNNQDHSMATALYAIRNVAGADHDVWEVNVEESYHEEVRDEKSPGLDRLIPQLATERVDPATVLSAFARYDPVALGGAVAAILGPGLLLATVVLLLRGGEVVGPNLSLLGQYLFGYSVSWSGAVVGTIEASLGGFLFGYLVARTINAIVAAHERRFLLEAELRHSQAGLQGVDM